MRTAKVFKNGGSQAIRLPKEFQIEEDELLITKIGSILLMVPKNHRWEPMAHSLSMLPQDTFPERSPQGEAEKRDSWA